jgi:hypothetical protein
MSIATLIRTTTMMRQAITPDASTEAEDGSVLSLTVPPALPLLVLAAYYAMFLLTRRSHPHTLAANLQPLAV